MNNSSTPSLEGIKPNLSETKARILEARAQRAHKAAMIQRRALRPADGYLPPASNTGGKSTGLGRGQITTIDTLTFSLELFRLGVSPELVMHDDDAIARAVEDLFLNHFDMEVGPATGRRVNGYHDSAPIRWSGHDEKTNGQCNAGYVAWGGNRTKDGHDTLCVHLTGQGCESINLLDATGTENVWELLVSALQQHAAKITRLDIAFDDLDGSYGGVNAAVSWYRQGGFTNGGRPPSINQVGDWINGHSRTFYIGKRANGKLCRIYEKGHELGDQSDPWTRYELELRSVDRVIPVAALLYPDELLAGSYPALEFVIDARPVSVPTIVKRRLTVTLDHLKKYASISYGRLINAMTGIGQDASSIIDDLRLDGLPRRLFVPPSAIQ